MNEAINKRKSVRKYSDQKLTQNQLNDIRNIISNSNSLYEDIDVDIDLMEGKKIWNSIKGIVGSYGKVEAPYYLIGSTEEKDGHLQNIGYILEHIILKLTTKELATCWIGGRIQKKELKNKLKNNKNLNPRIIVALGHPKNKDDLHRKKEPKRKKLEELIINDQEPIEFEEILSKARLAPSAMNSQPWRFQVNQKEIDLYIKTKRGLVNRVLSKVGNLDSMNRIDAGIALKHIEIAAQDNYEKIRITKKSNKDKKNYEYISTIEIS